ncbi:MAG TPA: hypothetical protein VKE69_09505 [Planctomycetota bacterium]|nr:hypothetical protein [Planctomycetota bacterium]
MAGEPDAATAALRARIEAPAIALMAFGLLSAAASVATAGLGVVFAALMHRQGPSSDMFPVFVLALVLVPCAFGFAASLFVAFAANRMRKGESYGLALAATVLAFAPISICWLLGIAIGIWSLVVLVDPNVRPAFRT